MKKVIYFWFVCIPFIFNLRNILVFRTIVNIDNQMVYPHYGGWTDSPSYLAVLLNIVHFNVALFIIMVLAALSLLFTNRLNKSWLYQLVIGGVTLYLCHFFTMNAFQLALLLVHLGLCSFLFHYLYDAKRKQYVIVFLGMMGIIALVLSLIIRIPRDLNQDLLLSFDLAKGFDYRLTLFYLGFRDAYISFIALLGVYFFFTHFQLANLFKIMAGLYLLGFILYVGIFVSTKSLTIPTPVLSGCYGEMSWDSLPIVENRVMDRCFVTTDGIMLVNKVGHPAGIFSPYLMTDYRYETIELKSPSKTLIQFNYSDSVDILVTTLSEVDLGFEPLITVYHASGAVDIYALDGTYYLRVNVLIPDKEYALTDRYKYPIIKIGFKDGQCIYWTVEAGQKVTYSIDLAGNRTLIEN